MDHGAQPPLGTTAFIYVIVIAIFVWRMMRPMRVSAARLWTRPGILVLLTIVLIYAEQVSSPSPLWQIAAVTFGGALVGVPLGVVRGRHSEVKSTERPGVYYVHSSPLVVVIWVAALLARAVIRYVMPNASHGVTLWTFGLLGFAASAIAVSAYLIHQKLIVVQRAQKSGS
ncbi:MAG TPA: hypothetical protein VGZ02_14775 [Candidatus Baltobacteraceae bacterium]|jgi:hypothetical protein|nr:hypothetical protein [Candidatus Baltobacteraceae bacterium]